MSGEFGRIARYFAPLASAEALGLADDASLRPAVVTIAELSGEMPEPEELAAAVAAGFTGALGVSFVRSELSEEERSRAAFLARERYGHERFTVRRDPWLPAGG